jgi:N-acetylglucosaminyl-diphospho-decaprenol L-rhamnosyltransferase
MELSVVVVTWNCADALATLVHSMNEYLDPSRVELVVVDNASDDAPLSVAAGWRGALETAALPENRGYGAACNAGIERASHDAVVLLNPDTWLVDYSLFQLGAAALERQALVGPRILNADGTVQPSASASLVGGWPWIRALLPIAAVPRWIAARTEPWRLDAPVRVAWLTGACVAAPREMFERLGPFDTHLEMFSEDLELGLRAGALGIPSYFLPNVARIVHVGDVSTSQRYTDGGVSATAANTVRVLRNRYGERRAARAVAAARLRLAVRVVAKRALGGSAARERAELAALAAAAKTRS